MKREQNKRDVRQVQQYLRRASQADDRIPGIGVDGIFGPETEAAVRAFQRAYRLPDTGVVDRITWQALAEVDAAIREYHRPAVGPALLRGGEKSVGPETQDERVWIVQAVLHRLHRDGVIAQPVEMTGRFDSATEQAVRQIQRMALLPVTGAVDRPTWQAAVQLYRSE